MMILAFDPGGTTGWVLYIDGQFLRSGQLAGEHHQELRDLILKYYYDYKDSGPWYVVYERFDHRNNEFAKLISCEFIGVIKEVCQELNLYAIPQGSSVKTFADDAKMRTTKWFIEYRWKHAWDAARHLYYFLVNGSHPYDQYRADLLDKLPKSAEL
jgi:hypothetical protein